MSQHNIVGYLPRQFILHSLNKRQILFLLQAYSLSLFNHSNPLKSPLSNIQQRIVLNPANFSFVPWPQQTNPFLTTIYKNLIIRPKLTFNSLVFMRAKFWNNSTFIVGQLDFRLFRPTSFQLSIIEFLRSVICFSSFHCYKNEYKWTENTWICVNFSLFSAMQLWALYWGVVNLCQFKCVWTLHNQKTNERNLSSK